MAKWFLVEMHIEVEESLGKSGEMQYFQGRCCQVTPVWLRDRAMAGIKRQTKVQPDGAKDISGIHCGMTFRLAF